VAQSDRIIFALDVGDLHSARSWVNMLKGRVGWFKIGLELFTATGPDIVKEVKDNGIKCFLDLKFHDIPNTVAGAVRSAVRTGADMMTVHLSGGKAMLMAAQNAAGDESSRTGNRKPMIVGVSVLTSLGSNDMADIGVERNPADQVIHLAKLASSCRLDGMVCSADDLAHIRRQVPEELMLVTPGIRPGGSQTGDQKRIATPSSALKAGADLLVIGRPISEAPDPVKAVQQIVEEMESIG
jgi:orotidine-5'-phosphate decarboxylase